MTSARAVRSVSASVISVGSVILHHDLSVPPGHELIIPGFVTNADFCGPAMLEPSADIEGLEFVPSMVTVSGQSVPCIVRNVSTEPVTIPKRSELGQLEVGVAEHPLCHDSQSKSDWRADLSSKLSSTNLSESEKQRVLYLFSSYEDMVDGRVGFNPLIQHHIDMVDAPPVRSSPRRVSPFQQEKVKAELDRMVEAGILEENFGSCWGSPMCVVTKKDGSLRICADLRRVNALTRIPAYGIPRVDAILDSLGGCSLFCVFDLKQFFYQIGMSPEDTDKTTIVTPFGLYRHRRMPMGISGAPMTCARLMDLVLRDLPPGTAWSYFDDILIGGSDFSDVMEKLELILSRLHAAGLTINLSKCSFFQKSVKFLGHLISSAGIAVDPDKIDKVANWPVPRTTKQLASFLGMASYMRKHVKDFALIAAPLQKLLHKDARFQWSDKAQASVDHLRVALCEAPILAVPDFRPDSGTFLLETDASLESAGACLKQRFGDQEKVIAYGSYRFSKAQTNYSTTKRELLAVVIFVEKFAPYLLGRQFVIRTDHSSLRWIMNFRNPTGILARWLESLARFQFTIEHRPGAEHVLADALSRLPADDVSDKACQTDPPRFEQAFRVTATDWSTSFIRAEQDKDPDISEVARHLSAGRKPKKRELCSPNASQFLSQWSRLRLIDGVLFSLQAETIRS